MLGKMKYWFSKKMAPLGKALGKVFSPNFFTIGGLLLGILSGIIVGGIIEPQVIYLNVDSLLLGIILLFVSGIFDALDGLVARATNRTSIQGAFLDSMVDRLVDAAIFFGLAYGGYISWEIAFLAFMFTQLISYARARGESLGLSMLGIGLMERQERFVYILVVLVLYWVYKKDIIIYWGFILYVALVFITFVTRFAYVYQKLRKKGKSSDGNS